MKMMRTKKVGMNKSVQKKTLAVLMTIMIRNKTETMRKMKRTLRMK